MKLLIKEDHWRVRRRTESVHMLGHEDYLRGVKHSNKHGMEATNNERMTNDSKS